MADDGPQCIGVEFRAFDVLDLSASSPRALAYAVDQPADFGLVERPRFHERFGAHQQNSAICN